MYVAPNFTVENWKVLKLVDMNHPDWQTAVDKFWQRINTRYLEPVKMLLENHVLQKADLGKESTERIRPGFVVMMIDFSLMESIQKFIEGITREDERELVNGKWKTKQGCESRNFFTRFIETCDLKIEDCGSGKPITKVDIENIYKYYRNQLTHSAGTGSRFTVKDEGEILKKTKVGKNWFYEMNRELFHQKIKAKIDDYIKELRKPEQVQLRVNFVRKFNEICETDEHKEFLQQNKPST